MTPLSTSDFWSSHWTHFAKAEHAWERDVQDAVRDMLQGHEPVHAWSKFDFLTLGGALFGADLLVVTSAGVFLIDFFEYRGELEVGERHWKLMRGGDVVDVVDSPVEAQRLKANCLRVLIDSHLEHAHAPKVMPLVLVVHDETLVCADSAAAAAQVVHLRQTEDDISCLSEHLLRPMNEASMSLDDVVVRRLKQGVNAAGLVRSDKVRRVKDWRCTVLLETSASHQDFVALKKGSSELSRVRLFYSPMDASKSRRERLRRAARREHELLQSLLHPGILQVRDFVEERHTSALVFEHPESTLRLDHYLQRQDNLSTRQRLGLLRDVTEALLYAHRKQIIHRALTPQSVRVIHDASGPAKVKVYNWQTALDTNQLTGTQHMGDYIAQDNVSMLAPESLDGIKVDETADVWGLGVIGYVIFAGHPPASNRMEMMSRLLQQKGLSLSAATNGVPQSLEQLILRATHPNPSMRTPSVAKFLEDLQEVWREVVGNTQDGEVDPLEAQPGDLLEGRWQVIRRLGTGASATALLVQDLEEEREHVLKVAQTERSAAGLEREAAVLRQLENASFVVSLRDVITVHGRRALVLSYAGETLRERLAAQGRLSLDDLRRVGTELFGMLEELEAAQTLHRDIKPANVGVGASKSRRRLTVFDFSLAGVRLEQLQVGTAAYRDPFLVTRHQWDEQADRYAAALTLYEMATGHLPVWGDGKSSPALIPDMDLSMPGLEQLPSVRESLAEFFGRALHRDVQQRFAHPSEMRRVWRGIFEDTAHTTTDHDVAASIEFASTKSLIRDLEMSDAAREALDRINVTDVGDLLKTSSQSLFFQRGISDAVRSELRALRNKLIHLPLDGVSEVHQDHDVRTISLDQCADNALDKHAELLSEVLHIREPGGMVSFEDRDTLVARLGMNRAKFEEDFQEIAQGWAKEESITYLRDDIVRLLEADGGVMRDSELAAGLLLVRGSLTNHRDLRLSLAGAVARIAVEAERASPNPRFDIVRVNQRAFIATDLRFAKVLKDLGKAADRLAELTPLRSSSRAYEELQRVMAQFDLAPIRRARLMSIAAQASRVAHLSSRLEFYPEGMTVSRTLALSRGSLNTLQEATWEEINKRVTSRYPKAEPLPQKEALSDLFKTLHIPLQWDPNANHGKGAFLSTYTSSFGLTGVSSTKLSGAFGALGDPGAQDANALQKDLERAWSWGGFRVLMAHERYVNRAPSKVLGVVGDATVLTGDSLWIDVFEQAIQTFPPVTWELIERVDGPHATTQERFNLNKLIRTWVCPRVEDALMKHQGASLILTDLGLFGRYKDLGAMSILENFSDLAGTPEGPRHFWLILPTDGQSYEPQIDHVTVPRTSPSQVMILPNPWLRKQEP